AEGWGAGAGGSSHPATPSPQSPAARSDRADPARASDDDEERADRGLMERAVVRVVTPGTVVEPALLNDRQNSYLVAAIVEGNRAGLAYVDVTTGEFAACQIDERSGQEALQRELARLAPVEVLVPGPDHRRRRDPRGGDGDDPLSLPVAARLSPYDAWHFDLETARDALHQHFEVEALDGFGCQGLPLAIRAAGAVLQYVSETQPAARLQLTSLRTYSTAAMMTLDPATRRNLELTRTARGNTEKGSLLWVLDRTQTAMGGRLLRTWINQPLLDLAKLQARQQAVAEFVEDALRRRLAMELLAKVPDLERLINRVGQRIATPRDLLALAAGLRRVGELRGALAGDDLAPEARIAWLAQRLDPVEGASELVGQAIVPDPPTTFAEGGVIRPGFSSELDQLKESSRHAREWIASLETTERERTGIRNLKVGYNRVFGYYLEVSNANRAMVPAHYIRKQTLVGAERYITPDLKEYESIVLNAQEKIAELETAIFRQVGEQIAASGERIRATAQASALVDVFAALAEVAVRQGYVRPSLDEGTRLEIHGGRHPVVECARPEEAFVANDVSLATDSTQIVLLTGPNMAGKSTYLRMTALIVLMAQIGSFVPAREATIGLVDRIFTRIGAQDDLSAGQSTFLLEMLETAHLLSQGTPRSLLILDEVGRGTSTYDGMAIAQAVIEYVHNHPKLGARTLFATHYHELTELEHVLPRVRNYRMDVLEEGDRVVFLHRVVPGGADRSYGIHVARLAGIPRAVTRRAEEILRDLEQGKRGRAGRRTGRGEPADGVTQLALFAELHPVVEEVRHLDVLALSPLEALTKLFELQERAREKGAAF
ncbi:MAG: DNA mismatch repair protein MutS, partial [Chloroflexi bacterium]|nr:DNA mismatch repair protein MutS [Chloroflexota bacterium]